MNFRLKTTAETGEILKTLYHSTNLTPNILGRIAISLSVLDPSMPDESLSDQGGLEFNRNTLTGDNDYFYKSLIRQHSGKEIPEEYYFPKLFNAHLTRGVKLLEQEYKHSGNYEKLLKNLLKLAKENLKGA